MIDNMKLAKFLCILGVVGMTTVCILLLYVYGITWVFIILLLAWCILYPAPVLDRERIRYKKGYDIMMEYFDDIPEEEREDVSKRLDEVDL